eukprot:TRINITY_DN2347_c0_g1_i6.p1 TRINITY_DN2347_c0_g1~~TRINITY_DN2347_c0_g1_i6.p1  ORF type:complete len:848 (-),score=160.54 TRINITY_DN2347_c0_g1_i6:333-2876(-)
MTDAAGCSPDSSLVVHQPCTPNLSRGADSLRKKLGVRSMDELRTLRFSHEGSGKDLEHVRPSEPTQPCGEDSLRKKFAVRSMDEIRNCCSSEEGTGKDLEHVRPFEQPAKPTQPRGEDSLRKKFAVKSMDELRTLRSSQEGTGKHLELVRPSEQPAKPTQPRGEDSLRKKFAVRSMGELRDLRFGGGDLLNVAEATHEEGVKVEDDDDSDDDDDDAGLEDDETDAEEEKKEDDEEKQKQKKKLEEEAERKKEAKVEQGYPSHQLPACFGARHQHRTKCYKPRGRPAALYASEGLPAAEDPSIISDPIARTLCLLNASRPSLGQISTADVSSSMNLNGYQSEDEESEAEDSDSSIDALSDSSSESSESEGEVMGGLSSLSLHPAHPCALLHEPKTRNRQSDAHQLVSLPGCTTAQELAEAGAQDLCLDAPVKNFHFAALEGKMLGTTDGMTLSVELACSEIASALVPSESRRCVIAVVPHEEPSRKQKNALGWLFTCRTEARAVILKILGRNGAVRRHLKHCYSPHPDAVVGSGAFGRIIRASCLNNPGQRVAVKMLDKTVNESNVRSEIQMLVAAQGSPFVVSFLSAFCDESSRSGAPLKGAKTWSLVFTTYPGDLYDRVVEGTRMLEQHAMPIAFDLLSAISYLQQGSIFHRDIKPENLLMTRAGGVVLTDFGLATHLSNLPEKLSDRGTIGYAAPEMLSRTATGFEGDNFGAGVVIYFMLSKSTPFLAPTNDLMIEKTMRCQVNLDFGCFEHLSCDCKDLILGLIRFSPNERLTVSEALANKAVFGKVTAVTEPTLKPMTRNAAGRSKRGALPGNQNSNLCHSSADALPALRRVRIAPGDNNISC